MPRREFNPYDNPYRWAERDDEDSARMWAWNQIDWVAETVKEFGRPANDNWKIERKKAA